MLRQSSKIYEPVSVLLLVIVSLFIFTFRLDNVHVFTDEVIYIKSGYEIFSNNYYLSGREIPMAGKYMAVYQVRSNKETSFTLDCPTHY